MSRRTPTRPSVPAGAVTPDQSIALCILAHQPYLKYLPECLAAWDGGRFKPEKKVLVLDNCDYEAPEGWDVIHGTFGHPSKGRNAGLQHLSGYDWIVYWDADNLPVTNFWDHCVFKAAFSDPEVGFYCGAQMRDPREHFVVDSGSLWRVSALLHAGGWPESWLEDWNLGNRLQALGWVPAPLGIPLDIRKHEEQRSKTESIQNKLWTARDLGVISLIRGDAHLAYNWLSAVNAMEFPARTGFTVVFDPKTSHTVRRAIQNTLVDRFSRATFLTCEYPFERTQELCGGMEERHQFVAVHSHVARLYSQAFNATPESAVLTWEDDVLPMEPQAVRKLVEALCPNRGLAAIAGVYPARYAPNNANFSVDPGCWRMPTLDSLPKEGLLNAGAVPGGFTLWSRAALEKAPFLGFNPKTWDGWDGFVSRRLVGMGYQLRARADVRCKHLTEKVA